MDWDQVEEEWDQVKGKLRQRWTKLTDEELDLIRGRRDRLAGTLHERYGLTTREAERRADELVESL